MMPQQPPRKFDYVEKVRLRACDLRPGMYVCELDRPWLETPYPLQGFEVRNDSDIETVMKYCEHVYIDMFRTKVIRDRVYKTQTASIQRRRRTAVRYKDLEAAEMALKQSSKIIKTFVEEVSSGHSPDIRLVRAVVSECVDKVINNPDITIFLSRLQKKGDYFSQHALNVCIYSIVIGRLLELDNIQLENLGTCGLLNDMGMVTIPETILNKPDQLTPEEMVIVQTHTTRGRDILMSGHDIFSGVVDVAYGHHENLDGTGYPRGLQGYQLSTNCKVVAVVDKYDAIVNRQRSHRVSGDHLGALAILNKLSTDNKIDSGIASAFVSYLGIYPPGCIVEMSSGEIGIIIQSNPDQRLRPQILVVLDANKEPTERFIDLAEKKTDHKGSPYRIVAVLRSGAFGIDLERYYDLIMQTCF